MVISESFLGSIEIRKEVVDITDLSRFVFTSKLLHDCIVNYDKAVEYFPYIGELVESIKRHGFILEYGGKSYHKDIYSWLNLPMCMILHDNGKFGLLHGGHRFIASKFAGLEEIPCYVIRPKDYTEPQLEEFRRIAQFLNSHKLKSGYVDLYQTWKFPGGVAYVGRDDSKRIFNGFEIPPYGFAGKSILDIACNTGYFLIRCGLYGAVEVAGFDVLGHIVDIARWISKAYNLECKVSLDTSEFWDYRFSREYDIVFCNQAIYHFTTGHRSKCKGNQDDVLNLISKVAKCALLMYTYVDVKRPPCNDGGYYPSSKKLIEDLESRGFNGIKISSKFGTKKHVIAVKE